MGNVSINSEMGQCEYLCRERLSPNACYGCVKVTRSHLVCVHEPPVGAEGALSMLLDFI